MKLNVKDRLMILGMLPQQGSLVDMVDIYDLARELKIDDKEREQINYREEMGAIKWDYAKEVPKDIVISINQQKILEDTINKLDKEKKIGLDQIETILKIKNG